MSFGLARGRHLDPGPIGVTAGELGPLPDTAISNPEAGRIDVRKWFAHPERPLEFEIGSGKGTFLLQQAELEPHTNFLGIEWAREFWLYATDRCRRRALENVRTLNTDAAEFLKWRVFPATVRVVHLYFPDPWPKTRHHRRRIVQEPFLEQCHRVLTEAGELRIVTDHEEYWDWMRARFAWASERDLFEVLPFTSPGSAGDGEVVGTNFERKYRREGRPFHAAVLRRLAGSRP
jgi:tRNA (guanine-N7-)-methyltransferase